MCKNRIDAQSASSISKPHVPDAKCPEINVLPSKVSVSITSISTASSSGPKKAALTSVLSTEKNGPPEIDFLILYAFSNHFFNIKG
jgi:hypothetical protein